MKYKFLLVGLTISFVIGSACAGTLQRGTASFSWDDHYQWDKKRLDSPPRVVGGPRAFVNFLTYPYEARVKRFEGFSIFLVRVDATGQVIAISCSPPIDRPLENAVVQAVRQCHWIPGKKNGRSATGDLFLPVKFQLSRER
ncbi:MAG: TonB family protein [Acidobacteriota bacterium]